jgi:hypothetical protein
VQEQIIPARIALVRIPSGPRFASNNRVATHVAQLTVEYIWDSGAGEGIRTLDPNLGKKLLQIPQSFFFYAKVRKTKLLLTSAYDILSSTYPAKR